MGIDYCYTLTGRVDPAKRYVLEQLIQGPRSAEHILFVAPRMSDDRAEEVLWEPIDQIVLNSDGSWDLNDPTGRNFNPAVLVKFLSYFGEGILAVNADGEIFGYRFDQNGVEELRAALVSSQGQVVQYLS